ncbi:MAG TPA: hypothetical protein VN709_04770 [Terriglobales bacterium]|nr:hypothetical protein [Terriglobales bacterium]
MVPFSADETRILSRLRRPERIQEFLDNSIAYNLEPDGDTLRSPRRVLRDQVAHCLEGALLAAAALRVAGHEPRLLDLESVRDDDHVLALFQHHGHWGAIGKSNYAGLRFREPVYRTLRELVLSYFEHYFNEDREKTLRNYSRPVNLARFDRINWMTSEQDLWPINDYLVALPHTPLFRNRSPRGLARVDTRLFHAGKHGQV